MSVEEAAQAGADKAFPPPYRHNMTAAMMVGLQEARKREGYVRGFIEGAAWQAARPDVVTDATRAAFQAGVAWHTAQPTTVTAEQYGALVTVLTAAGYGLGWATRQADLALVAMGMITKEGA